MALPDISRLDDVTLKNLTDDQFRGLMANIVQEQRDDRRENQIIYYKPVSEIAISVHNAKERYVGIGGGNGASKSDTVLAHFTMLTTGVFSDQLDEATRASLREQFRGPIAVRVVVESLTTTLHPIILPKLQYWKWNGIDEPGGDRGHWGWIPRSSLKNGSWVGAWSEKLRQLTVICRDPDTGEELGESTWQFMGKDQDPSDFASGDFHHIMHDELPSYAIWRENEARTMRVAGKMWLSFTWPDDPAFPVDWVYDEVYEQGQPGPDKNPEKVWFEMWTKDNPNLDQDSVAKQELEWSDEVRAVRLYGRPIRFSNRIHPLFTDHEQTWCVMCKTPKISNEGCERCFGDPRVIVPYCHVKDFELVPGWPTICLLDPHPRKPHMLLWVQVDPYDDLWAVAEALVPGGPDEVREECDRIELELGLRVVERIGDRNMLRSPSSARHREQCWKDEFAEVGLFFQESDVSDVGRERVNEYLKVDSETQAPRLHFHPRCSNAIRQMKRYVWDEYRETLGKDVKQKPKEKEDDFPTLMKYLMNYGPSFRMLSHGAPVIRTR